MNLNISVSRERVDRLLQKLVSFQWEKLMVPFAVLMATIATTYSFLTDHIISYGDAESHLNIAKRVVDGLTNGFAQLGGIWLPVPHLLMVPFVAFDGLWRTGLAGSIVSGISYTISAVLVYKTMYMLTKNRWASLVSFLVFATNLNILYMQSTPMTELPLIVFFMLSSYYFVKFIKNPTDSLSLIFAAFFGFIASLARYDGWFLVLFEAMVIVLVHFPFKQVVTALKTKDYDSLFKRFQTAEGQIIMFATLAFFGILLWLIWGYLILGDPFYFTTSSFSAKSQQQAWLRRGELPAYNHLGIAFLYYFITTLSNAGVLPFLMGLVGIIQYLFNKKDKNRFYVMIIYAVPFIFNVYTMFVGQSVVFIPHLTPTTFEWTLFNVRYGIMMVPTVAFGVGYLFMNRKQFGKALIIGLLAFQMCLYVVGYSKVITFADGSVGLSRAKRPDAEYWIKQHYDHGLVLLDDYARTLSILRSGIKMQDVIYIGNKPYWEESLVKPEKYARWIVMQRNDTVWNHVYADPKVQGRLYKYFEKAYTSPDILIFRRKDGVK